MSRKASAPLKRNNPPGPQGDLLGLRSLRAFNHDVLSYLMQLTRTYGDVVRFPFGPFEVYLVSRPELVYQILVQDADKFLKTRALKRILESSLGNGLLVNDGEAWRKQRRMVQPAFHMKRIENYAGAMVDFAQRIGREWQPGQLRDIHHDMMRLTMNIVSKTLFDADVSAEADRVGAAITTGLEVTNAQFSRLINLPAWLPTRENRKGKQALQTINDVVMGFIRARRASGEDKGDLLSMLMLSVDEEGKSGMTDKQVRDEAYTLFVAGHETTANALTWTWYLLATHPQVMLKLREELDAVLSGRAPMLSDLPNLPYTDVVLKESMRLYPPAWTVTREATQDIQLGEYLLPAGRVVFLSQYVSHHNPLYFAQPDEFMPERWADGFEKKLPRFAYYPFGAGPRICIGNTFALMEARLVLAELAQHFTLTMQPGFHPIARPSITLRPANGMQMVVHRR
jgi:cytochrome P450